MKFRVRHSTRYQYSMAVSDGQSSTVLLPRTTSWQRVERADLLISPEPRWQREYQDWFGNRRCDFAVESIHDFLQVVADSRVEVIPPLLPEPASTPAWESALQDEPLLMAYRLPSGLVPGVSDGMRDYALQSFTPRRPLMQAALELTQRIYADFAYVQGVTEISTPVAQVFESRAGVCQDFAHLQLALLRSLGLACRYVSGYIETRPAEGQAGLVGADASHAWISLHVPGTGWIDFDPTNNQIPSDRHVVVAWGRDYSDVVPVKGYTSGGGAQTLQVAVEVSADQDGPEQRWL